MENSVFPSKSVRSNNSRAKKSKFSKLNASDLIIPYDCYDLEVITVNVTQAASGGMNSYTLVA